MKFFKTGINGILVLVCTSVSFSIFAEKLSHPNITEKNGSLIFHNRCTICHGNFGMGEGILPLLIKDYPDTNLRALDNKPSMTSLHNSVVLGGTTGKNKEFMPPWGDELSYNAVESVVKFLAVFYADTDKAYELLEKAQHKVAIAPNTNYGRAIFRGRCMVCHGESGDGQGAMAKRLKIPAANFISSRQNDAYLEKIILEGGAGVSRSFQMPPWEGTLSPSEISSVIMYIKTLRK